MTKSELRQLSLNKRGALTVNDVAELSGRIADRFFSEVNLAAVRTIHTFIRIRKFNELDTSIIYYRLWRDYPSIRTFAPRIDPKTGEMESVFFDSATKLIENDWGIREPAGSAMTDHDIDIVLIPLLCFDERGYRVGYGKGYYDRFLRKCRPDCRKVGLSFFPPVERIDDVYEGDVALDYCVTSERLYMF